MRAGVGTAEGTRRGQERMRNPEFEKWTRKGLDGKITYNEGTGEYRGWEPENAATEISVKLFAIIPPEGIMPEPEERAAEVERQLREGIEKAIKQLKEKMLRSTGQKSVLL